MDELRGNEAIWVFDSERIKIRYEAKGRLKNPLHKQLGVLEIPVGAIRSVDFQPKAGADGGEPEKTLIMAATVVAHVWARGAATRPALGSGEVTDADIDDRPDLTDPGWWRDAAQSAVKSLVGPRAGLDLSGLRGRGGEDTAALGEGGGEVGQKKELTASTAPRKLGHDTEWVYVQIECLGELKEKGLLTEEEFTAKKAELLDRI